MPWIARRLVRVGESRVERVRFRCVYSRSPGNMDVGGKQGKAGRKRVEPARKFGWRQLSTVDRRRFDGSGAREHPPIACGRFTAARDASSNLGGGDRCRGNRNRAGEGQDTEGSPARATAPRFGERGRRMMVDVLAAFAESFGVAPVAEERRVASGTRIANRRGDHASRSRVATWGGSWKKRTGWTSPGTADSAVAARFEVRQQRARTARNAKTGAIKHPSSVNQGIRQPSDDRFPLRTVFHEPRAGFPFRPAFEKRKQVRSARAQRRRTGACARDRVGTSAERPRVRSRFALEGADREARVLARA